MRKHLIAVTIGAVAALSFTAGCSDEPSPATTTSSATAPSASVTSRTASPAPGAEQPAPAPTHTATATARPTTTKPQGPNNGGTYEVPCTGPDQGTICTNPNHGAGTNPADNGTAPTTSTTKVRDDDPGGKPCTTGMGVAGVYIYSEDSQQWVCQIG